MGFLRAGCLLACTFLAATASAERPKIGLALGGGSARGIAHVGVLEWLEEKQIPVDFIAGTSMGGLVGATYATGMSAAEVRELLRDVDWDLLFLGEVPYGLKSFRRKEDRRELPTRFALGLRGGIRVPSGIDPGHQVGLLLSRIALPYGAVPDFDALPIPFRAVATDMERAEVTVLGDGSLSQALLATMAIPGVFPPVKRDGATLADGGLLDNVPADVVRAMGADIVIAVDVGAVRDTADLDSAFTAASQAIDVMIAAGTRRALEQADVVVTPDLRGFDSLDWRRSEALADRGRLAAEDVREALEDYRLGDEEWGAHLAARQSRRREEALEPAFLDVHGVESEWERVLEGRLASHVGTPVDFDALHEDLTAITGSERFERLRYEQTARDGARGLTVIAREKTYGPPFLRFSLGISNENQDIDFNFGARLTALDVGKTGAELRVDADVGSVLGALGEYYRPLGSTPFFVAPRAFYARETRNEFEGDDLIANRRDRRAALGIDFGFTTSRNTEFRLGYQLGDVDSAIRVGDPGLPRPAGREELLRARFVFDGQDAPIIPRRGVRTEIQVEWYEDAPDAERAFGRAAASAIAFVPTSEEAQLLFTGRAAASLGGSLPFFYDFNLGGPLRLSSFELGALRGDNLLYGNVGYLHSVARLPDFLGGRVYLTGLVEAGSVFDAFDDARVELSAGGGFVMDTAFGPIFAILSGGSGGTFQFYFAVGRLLSP